MINPTPPERACVLTLKLGADSRDELLSTLRGIIWQIEAEQLTEGCSGGVGSGYTYKYTEAERPTAAEYQAQVKAYLAATKGDNR